MYTKVQMYFSFYFYKDLNLKSFQLPDWHFLQGNFEATWPTCFCKYAFFFFFLKILGD